VARGAQGWPCRGQVVLAIPAAEVAPHVGDGLVEEIGPGHCRLTLGSWSWVGLAVTVGRFDADFEVVGPRELSDAVAVLAARYAAAAGAAGSGEPRGVTTGTVIGTQESDEVPMKYR
jgi:hypothetical protein